MKKEDQVNAPNGTVNGIDDDKGFKWVFSKTFHDFPGKLIQIFQFKHFSRTPGSRQPSPAEEHLQRQPNLLEAGPIGSSYHHQMGHILNPAADHQQQMNSYHHPHHPLNHLVNQQSVMNGGMPVPQVSPIRNYHNVRGFYLTSFTGSGIFLLPLFISSSITSVQFLITIRFFVLMRPYFVQGDAGIFTIKFFFFNFFPGKKIGFPKKPWIYLET